MDRAMGAFLMDPSLPIWMEINSTCPIDLTSSRDREIIHRKDIRADVAWAVRGQEQRLFRQAADQVLNKGPIITLSLGENPLHIRLALPNFFALKQSFRSRLAGFVFLPLLAAFSTNPSV